MCGVRTISREDFEMKIIWISYKIIDRQGNITSEVKFRVFMALIDNIPIILGFKDLLDRLKLTIRPIQKWGI